MHTVDSAQIFKRTIGCYLPDKMDKGDYSGNEYIIKEKGAVKVSDTQELSALLRFKSTTDSICNRPDQSDYHQMSLTELFS